MKEGFDLEKNNEMVSLIENIMEDFEGQDVIILTATEFSIGMLSFVHKVNWAFGKDSNGDYINISDSLEEESSFEGEKGTILTLYLDQIINVLYSKYENGLDISLKDGIKLNIIMNYKSSVGVYN